jgi:hypothetical protein
MSSPMDVRLLTEVAHSSRAIKYQKMPQNARDDLDPVEVKVEHG